MLYNIANEYLLLLPRFYSTSYLLKNIETVQRVATQRAEILLLNNAVLLRGPAKRLPDRPRPPPPDRDPHVGVIVAVAAAQIFRLRRDTRPHPKGMVWDLRKVRDRLRHVARRRDHRRRRFDGGSHRRCLEFGKCWTDLPDRGLVEVQVR